MCVHLLTCLGEIPVVQALNKKGPTGDISSLDLEVCFDDFVELFCRLVVSNLWVFEPEQEAGKEDKDKDRGMGVGTEMVSGGAAIVEAALAERLSNWLPLI